MKKSLIMSLLVGSALMFAGCVGDESQTIGDSGSNDGENNANESVTEGSNPDADVQLTVNLWAQPHEEEIYQTVIDEFMDANPDVNVEFVVTPGDDYSTRLQTLMAGNQAPDIFYLGAGDANFYTDTGRVLDVTDMVEESDVIDLDKIWESGTERYTIDDRIYALPKDVGPFGYAFNKDLFDEAGIEYPDSEDPYDWNEYIEVAKQLTFDENGNTPNDADFDVRNVEQYGAGFWWVEPAVYSNGAHWVNEDATEITMDTPEFKEALQFVADLRLEHQVVPSPEAEESSNSYARWLNGEVAMFPMGPWDTAAFWELDFDYDLMHWPKSPNTGETITWLGSLGFAVSADSDHPEEAFELAAYLSIDEDSQRNLMERGAGFPNLIEMAETEYLELDFAPENKQVFLDIATTHSQPLPAELTYDGEWFDYFGQTIVDVWEGRKTVDEYVEEVAPRMQSLLDESNERAERARSNQD